LHTTQTGRRRATEKGDFRWESGGILGLMYGERGGKE